MRDQNHHNRLESVSYTHLDVYKRQEEAGRAAYLFARGGRFEPAAKGRDDAGQPSKRWPKPLMVWNPEVGSRRHSQSGQFLSGTPRFFRPQLADGTPLNEAFKPAQWPLLLTSYKSHTCLLYTSRCV